MGLGRNLAAEDIPRGRRGEILAWLRECPGASFTEIARRLGLAHGPVAHHLQVLERFGQVTSLRSGRFRRYYAAGTVPVARRAAHALQRSPRYALLLAILAQTPEASHAALAARMGRSRQAMTLMMRNLERAGAITCSREDRGRCDPRSVGAIGISVALPLTAKILRKFGRFDRARSDAAGRYGLALLPRVKSTD